MQSMNNGHTDMNELRILIAIEVGLNEPIRCC